MTEPSEPADSSALPVVEPPESAVAGGSDTTPTVAAVLLAAGTSSRYGERNKLLATHDGAPLVRRAARTLLDARVESVTVVVGHEADHVRDALADLDVEIVHNDAYETGQASSVRVGVRAVRNRADAVLIALGDMPFVSPATVDALVASYEAGTGDALAAAHDGARGNPVLFDARFFDDLTAVDGDIGGRELLLESEAGALVAVDDPGVRRDIDTPADLADSS
ncbi:nucleotidyltransferase family protein [Halobacteria archaeon AArc-dxtr1]|nr:nucleotidyltransferase family protein [Halobacteria archaeon AArc-dxtr1]